MTDTEAASILEALIRGLDPDTGRPLPLDGPLGSLTVVKALGLGVASLYQRAQMVPDRLANAGKPWTDEEHDRLVSAFDDGVSVEDLAVVHKRTQLAVAARLADIGRMPRGEVDQYQRPRKQ